MHCCPVSETLGAQGCRIINHIFGRQNEEKQQVWVLFQGQEQGDIWSCCSIMEEGLWAWTGGGMGKKWRSWPLGHATQCSPSTTTRDLEDCLTGSLENTYFQHQALICGSELSSAPHDFPSETSQLHCITIIPTSSLQQVPEHHPALISTGNQQRAVPSSSWLSPRQQVCSLWHE